jgi:hydrogenase nickel incorporation protein HypB
MTQANDKKPGEGSGPSGHPRQSPTALIRGHFAKSHTLLVRLVGPPGSGKTELIEATLRHLPVAQRVAVIAINPASNRDAHRLSGLCGRVSHIDAAVPPAREVWNILSQLDPEQFDFVLIESAGGLGTLPDLGQDATVAVFSVSGGDDKAAEYSNLLQIASAAILTKIDLRSVVRFDVNVFRADVERINPRARLVELSSTTGAGVPAWLGWLHHNRSEKRDRGLRGDADTTFRENFVG